MSRWRFAIEVEVDDEALAGHLKETEGTKPPYSGPDEWDASDLQVAFGEEIAIASESELSLAQEVRA